MVIDWLSEDLLGDLLDGGLAGIGMAVEGLEIGGSYWIGKGFGEGGELWDLRMGFGGGWMMDDG